MQDPTTTPAIDPAGVRARSLVLRALRRWFDDHGYLETPTPVRVPSPAMEAQLFALSAEGAYLRTSPEFALKRLVAAGLPRVYEIGPCFRAMERGPWHATEFTMLEWYRAGATLHDLMAEVRALVAAAAQALQVPGPDGWQVVTVRDLMRQRTGLDIQVATAAELSPRDADDWDAAFFRRWIEDVEPGLTRPTFVTDWPASQAALAQVHHQAEGPIAQRFEVFLGGVELANAFLELTDAREQQARFAASEAERSAQGHAPHPVDHDFILAVGRMPPTAGIAMGVDRLVAALAGWPGIHRGRVRSAAWLEES